MFMCMDVCQYLYMHAGQRGEHWQRKQIQGVAGLRVKLHGNTILSALTLLPSLCVSLALFLYLLPSLYSSWQQLADLKKWPDPK